jgi:hypothetical protein
MANGPRRVGGPAGEAFLHLLSASVGAKSPDVSTPSIKMYSPSIKMYSLSIKMYTPSIKMYSFSIKIYTQSIKIGALRVKTGALSVDGFAPGRTGLTLNPEGLKQKAQWPTARSGGGSQLLELVAEARF